MKSSNLSIRATLLLIIGVLNILIGLLVGSGVYRSWISYRQAVTLQHSSTVLNTLYRTERYLSLERGDSVPVLYTSAETKKNLTDDIAVNRVAADSGIKQIIGALAKDHDPAVAAALKKVEDRYAQFQKLRSTAGRGVASA